MPRTQRQRAGAGETTDAVAPAPTDEMAADAESTAALTGEAATAPTTRRAPRRRRAVDQPDATTEAEGATEPSANGATVVETATSETIATGPSDAGAEAAPAPTRTRGRGRTRREPAAAAAAHPAADTVAPDEDDTAAVAIEAIQTEAMVEAAESPPAEAEPVNPWAPTRRFEVGPDGRVRFVDGGTAAATPAATPSVPPPAVERRVDEPFVTTAVAEDDEAVIAATAAEEEAIARALAAGRETGDREVRPQRGRRPRGERMERAEDDDRAIVSADVSAAVEGIAVDDAPEAEVIALAGEDSGALIDTETIDAGFAEGESTTEALDEERRPRRRSRRGGRGRRRDVVRPDEELIGGEALEPELAAEEGVGLVELTVPEPTPIREPLPLPARDPRPRGGAALSPLEQLVARQNVILDQLLQRQERMAGSLEQTLKMIDSRLRGTDLSHVASMPRVAVFVDVPNIVYAAERYKKAVDFGKLVDYIAHDRTLVRATAYAPISDDPSQRLEIQRFVEPFVDHGYRIVTKALKRFADGSIKANFDVEMAMDILTMSERLDIVTLVSGDGDFRRLLDIVASKGVRVEVVSFRQSTSSDLVAGADSYVDLTQHLNDLCVPIEGDFRPRQTRPKVDISGYTEGSQI